MKYLLDTAVCIGFLRPSAKKALHRLEAIPRADLSLSAIVHYELLYGSNRSGRPQSELDKVRKFLAWFRCLNFEPRTAEIAGRIRADLERKGTPIGPHDILIAATALQYDLTLVSGNLSEFRRVEGLRVENWEQ